MLQFFVVGVLWHYIDLSNISAAVGAISTKFGIVMQFHLLTVLTVEN